MGEADPVASSSWKQPAQGSATRGKLRAITFKSNGFEGETAAMTCRGGAGFLPQKAIAHGGFPA